MATIRGRALKVGGVATQPQGGASRTDTSPTSATGASSILRPAYSFNASILRPTMPSSFTSAFDPSSILFWRLLLVGAAVLYIYGYHVKLPVVGRVRV
jgi:hypothetical protein